ncbi:MAG: hypothetical protein Q8R37_02700 [Nanoarchaeota archaeon]|nr:hypothetical protein [Nanoarchaeota archaeon]
MDNHNAQRGTFIAFESADNLPLFWHSANVEKYLQECLKMEEVITINPYQGSSPTPSSLTSLYNTTITFLLNEGFTVIAERYTLSAIVHEVMKGNALTTVIEKYQDIPVPDITFYLNLSTFAYQNENNVEHNLFVNNGSPCICKESMHKIYEELIRTPLAGGDVFKFSKVDKNFVAAALPGTVYNYLRKTRNLRAELSAVKH